MNMGTFEAMNQMEMMEVNGGGKRHDIGNTVASAGAFVLSSASTATAETALVAGVSMGVSGALLAAGVIYCNYKYVPRDINKRSHHR